MGRRRGQRLNLLGLCAPSPLFKKDRRRPSELTNSRYSLANLPSQGGLKTLTPHAFGHELPWVALSMSMLNKFGEGAIHEAWACITSAGNAS